MQINDVMTHRASYVSSDASLSEAVRVMCTDDVAYLPVCEHGRVAGSITQHDIVTHSKTQSGSPDNTSVRAIMSGDTSAVWIDADIDEATQLMRKKQLRRLPVLNRDGRLVGVVSIGDLARGQYRLLSHGRSELSDRVSPQAVISSLPAVP